MLLLWAVWLVAVFRTDDLGFALFIGYLLVGIAPLLLLIAFKLFAAASLGIFFRSPRLRMRYVYASAAAVSLIVFPVLLTGPV